MGHCNMRVHKWCVKDLSVCLRIPIQGHGLEERDWDVEAKANNNLVDCMIEQKH